MPDENQTELDFVLAKIERGENLTEDEVTRFLEEAKPLSEQRVNNRLCIARDKVLHLITKALLIGKMVGKNEVRVFNALQNAVERHGEIHGRNRSVISDDQKVRVIEYIYDDRPDNPESLQN